MTVAVTYKFRINNAEQFKAGFDIDSDNQYYMFFARPAEWANTIPTANVNIKAVQYDPWRNMVGIKKISPGDVSLCVPKYIWSNNTFYQKYTDDNDNLFTTNFYVLTSDNNVYKCLDNNSANSVVKPTGTTSGLINTSDGYVWKYMYTVSSAEDLKFTTPQFIPVKGLSANDGSAQWTIQQAASNGSIDIISVVNGGSAYPWASNTFVNVTNTTSVILGNEARPVSGVYANASLYIATGAGAGQIRVIEGYNGSLRRIKLATPFTVTPNTSSSYVIGPSLVVTGDGVNLSAYANTYANGVINKVNIINRGTSYSAANVAIVANTGSGGVLKAYTSPYGGHGANAVNELGGFNVVVNSKFQGDQANTFVANNNFCVYGLIKNPRLVDNSIASLGQYDMTTKLMLTSVTGTFVQDEFISDGTAQGRVVAFANTNASANAGVLSLVCLTNAFSNNNTVIANTSGATALITTINNPLIRKYRGDVMFIENISPITRDPTQTEDIKLVVRF